MGSEAKSEAQIQFEILKAYGAHPAVFMWRQNTGVAQMGGRTVRFGIPGTPDVFMILAPSGRFVGVECKTAKGRQSEDQRRFQAALERRGGLYILARDVETVDRALAAEGITR